MPSRGYRLRIIRLITLWKLHFVGRGRGLPDGENRVACPSMTVNVTNSFIIMDVGIA
jgi:hypothetical protein